MSRLTTISYSTCQYVATHLVRLGILTTNVEHGVEYFTVCSIHDFTNWIDERRQEIDEQYEDAKKEMRLFLKMVREDSWKPNVNYFEGIEGIKAIYNDMIETGKDICAWTDISLIEKTLGVDFLNDYIKRRVKKGIQSSSILQRNEVNVAYSEREQKRESKIVDQLPINGEIRVYGAKVAVITFEQDNLVGFVLESPTVAEMFRLIFKDHWEKTS